MLKVLKAQGLDKINDADGNEEISVKPDTKALPNMTGMAIRNWETFGESPWAIANQKVSFDIGMIEGAKPPAFTMQSEAHDAWGVAGQGNSPNPPSGFKNHFIVRINGKLYDPSYGIGEFTTETAYEASAFAGWFSFDTDDNMYRLNTLVGQICVYSP